MEMSTGLHTQVSDFMASRNVLAALARVSNNDTRLPHMEPYTAAMRD